MRLSAVQLQYWYMLQSLSLPSHFISISSQEAGNNLQINCHFYGTGAGGWDSLCPPIKDDVAVKKIKGNFLFTYPHAVVQYIISVWCLVLQGCYGFSLKCGNYFSWYRFSKIAWPPRIVSDLLHNPECYSTAKTCCKSKCKCCSIALWSFEHRWRRCFNTGFLRGHRAQFKEYI